MELNDNTDLFVCAGGHVCTQVEMTRGVHKHHLESTVELRQRRLKRK